MYGSRAVLIVLVSRGPEDRARPSTSSLSGSASRGSPPCRRPPAIVGKLFGIRYLATLFGLTLLSHQIGGFFGAWLGGIAIARLGSYQWMWYADIALATFAALVNLPIREARVQPASAAAPA